MNPSWIDLRSDTVTRPTPEMRRAMAEAEVGDDVYHEDPTINRLEQRAAEIIGKEAAIFVPTGTMGNTIAIKLHTQHGDEVVCDIRSHLMDWELSMCAWFSGCLLRTPASPDGVLTWDLVRPFVRTASDHNSRTACLEIENTFNMAGGRVYPLEVLDDLRLRTQEHGLKLHMDGARIFNAATALGVPASRLASCADTVMFCLSKGLGAPVGSMLAGPRDLIRRAYDYRKRLGGAMRQAGVLAAAGLVALERMPHRLAEDHANARLLAAGLDTLGFAAGHIETNIVIFDPASRGFTPTQFLAALKERGVLAGGASGGRVRFVTHFDVSRENCQSAIEAVREMVQ
jgi:threonine aldolase